MLQKSVGSPAVQRRATASRQVFGCSNVRVNTRAARSARLTTPVVCQAAAAEPLTFKGDLLNASYYPTRMDAANLKKKWYIIDAKGQTLGRLATLAATYIRGKHSPSYAPSMDMGAYVVVVNADQVVVTGRKPQQKTYFRHVNGRPGSWKVETFEQLQQRVPERIVEKAVQGMLPKGPLGRKIRLHLKVYKGSEHPHTAQQPQDITARIDAKPAPAKKQ